MCCPLNNFKWSVFPSPPVHELYKIDLIMLTLISFFQLTLVPLNTAHFLSLKHFFANIQQQFISTMCVAISLCTKCPQTFNDMIPYVPLPVLPTPSPSLILSRSVTSVYSRQDSLTMAAPPTSIQEIPCYRPTPTPGRENCSITVWMFDKYLSNIQ